MLWEDNGGKVNKRSKKDMKHLLNKTLILLVGLSMMVTLVNCSGQGKKQDKKTTHTVKVITVSQNAVSRSVDLFGSIYGDLQVTVTPKIAGRVTQIVKPEGSKVNENDTILFILNDVPGMDYKPGPLLAPISGTVGKIYADVGQMVAPAMPVALIAQYSDNVKVKAPISDQDLPYVQKSAVAKISVSALANSIFEGRVTNISTVVDQMSGSATVEITVPNQNKKLIPGMACSINLLLEQKGDVIALPLLALFTDGFSKVLVVDNNNTARFRNITVGLVGNEMVEIKSGLNIGEKVITTGKERVGDGDVVTIAEEK
jgi:multidrug efflux pump subunit AcrA (membrane-fusion protein)